MTSPVIICITQSATLERKRSRELQLVACRQPEQRCRRERSRDAGFHNHLAVTGTTNGCSSSATIPVTVAPCAERADHASQSGHLRWRVDHAERAGRRQLYLDAGTRPWFGERPGGDGTTRGHHHHSVTGSSAFVPTTPSSPYR